MQPSSTHRGLSTARIVEAALALADEGGLEAVSLRRVAAQFGVTPMAIYRHVRDKDQLLDLMADRVLSELDVAAAAGPSWQEALRRVGASLLAVAAAHPAAPLLLSRPFDSPAAHRLAVVVLAILGRAGFGQGESIRLLQVLTGMLLGPAIHRATYAAARRETPLASLARPATQSGEGTTVEPPTGTPQIQDWVSGADADRITIDLWVSGVEALASRRDAHPRDL